MIQGYCLVHRAIEDVMMPNGITRRKACKPMAIHIEALNVPNDLVHYRDLRRAVGTRFMSGLTITQYPVICEDDIHEVVLNGHFAYAIPTTREADVTCRKCIVRLQPLTSYTGLLA